MHQAEMSFLQLNPAIQVRVQHVGAEMQPLMIVDNVLADPEAMIQAATEATFYVPPHTNYPGINARLPANYYQTIIATLRGPLEAAFGLSSAIYLNYFGFFRFGDPVRRRSDPGPESSARRLLRSEPTCPGPLFLWRGLRRNRLFPATGNAL